VVSIQDTIASRSELSWHRPYEIVHTAEVAVDDAKVVLGGLVAWITNTLASGVLGILVGAVVVAVAVAVAVLVRRALAPVRSRGRAAA
jgi:predicted DNA repair protein MutK